MNITEEEVKHIEKVMRDAKAALEKQKQENAILVKMLVKEKEEHEALKAYVRKFAS